MRDQEVIHSDPEILGGTLPRHLQDAIDRLLIDEVRGEREQALALDTVLAGDADS